MNEDKFLDSIAKKLPTEKSKVLMIATILGSAGLICEFIAHEEIIDELPLIVKYACALIASNMIALTSDEKEIKFEDLSNHAEKYQMGEQTQEAIFRKMKYIIESLHKNLKEMENEKKL